jgi:Flp pilus assembly protein TadG
MARVTDSRTSRQRDARRAPRRTGLWAESGQALMEAALTLPLLLLVSVGIFEFGRAYQTWQVLTNAAREGARVAVLPNTTPADVQARVLAYMQSGQLENAAVATVAVDQNVPMSYGAASAPASTVTINYPFSFIVLNPVARLIANSSTLGAAPVTLSASAEMRNEP